MVNGQPEKSCRHDRAGHSGKKMQLILTLSLFVPFHIRVYNYVLFSLFFLCFAFKANCIYPLSKSNPNPGNLPPASQSQTQPDPIVFANAKRGPSGPRRTACFGSLKLGRAGNVPLNIDDVTYRWCWCYINNGWWYLNLCVNGSQGTYLTN